MKFFNLEEENKRRRWMEISSEKNNEIAILLDFGISEEGYEFASNIQMAMKYAEFEMSEIVSKLYENENILKKLTPERLYTSCS